MKSFKMLVTAIAACMSLTAHAATHYVNPTATGNQTGTDWTNAYKQLPDHLVRGDLYLLADGVYPGHLFNDPPSGKQLIRIAKATVEHHGTNVGWNPSMGDGQAVFPYWNVFTDYYRFNGRRRNADWWLGNTDQYGLKVAGKHPLNLTDLNTFKGSNHISFYNVDFVGGGRDPVSDPDDVVYGVNGNSYMTWQNCALHDSGRTIFLTRGNWVNLTVDHSYIARNTSTTAVHGEAISLTDSQNGVWTNNVMEDIEGTAVIALVNTGTSTNWNISGNVTFFSDDYINHLTPRDPNHNWGVSGFVFVGNDNTNNGVANNWTVNDNTFVNMQGLWSGFVIEKGTNNVGANNVWYNSVRTNNGGIALKNDWYFNTLVDGDSDPSTVVCKTACNVFKNISGKDFHLISPIVSGENLGVPFNVDMDGNVRVNWNRGAYEYIQ